MDDSHRAPPHLNDDRTPVSRRELALNVLRSHRVVTLRQLDRLYGVPARVLTGLPRVTLTVSPLHMRESLTVDATFVSLSERALRQSPGALAHLAGTAEMQSALGVPLAHWRAQPSGRGSNRPDAEYDDPEARGVHAAEYDSGTYTRSKISEKLAAFKHRYLSTVWGVGSSVRRDHIADLIPRIIVVEWWISERRNG